MFVLRRPVPLPPASHEPTAGPASLRCWNRTNDAALPAGMAKRALSAAPGHTHIAQRMENRAWALAAHSLGGMAGARLALKTSGLALSAVETSVLRMEHAWRYTCGFVQVFRRKKKSRLIHPRADPALLPTSPGPHSLPFGSQRSFGDPRHRTLSWACPPPLYQSQPEHLRAAELQLSRI